MNKSDALLPLGWYLAVSVISHVVIGGLLLIRHNASTGGGLASSLQRVTMVNLVDGSFGVEQLTGEFSKGQGHQPSTAEITALLGTGIILDSTDNVVTSNGVLQSGPGWSGMSNPKDVSEASRIVTCERISDIVAKVAGVSDMVYISVNKTVPTSVNTYSCQTIVWGDSNVDMHMVTPIPDTDPNNPGGQGGIITFKEAGVPDTYAYISGADRDAHSGQTPPTTGGGGGGGGGTTPTDCSTAECPDTNCDLINDSTGYACDRDCSTALCVDRNCDSIDDNTFKSCVTYSGGGSISGGGTGDGTGDGTAYGIGNPVTGVLDGIDPLEYGTATLPDLETGLLTETLNGIYNNNPVVSALKNTQHMDINAPACTMNFQYSGHTIDISLCPYQEALNTVGTVLVGLSGLFGFFIIIRRS